MADLITSKELLAREKDREHLPLLKARQAELLREPDIGLTRDRGHLDRGRDAGLDLGF